MTHFVYKKENGEVTERDVEPIGFTFGDRDKVLCIDYNGLDEEDKVELEHIRKSYLKMLYDGGFGNNIRSFFLDNILELGE
jgi:hypothetical protein